MKAKELLLPIIQQIESLIKAIQESPYISRESRLSLAKEIERLSEQINEGHIPCPKMITAINQKAAADEVATLTVKIRSLNPNSPRLDHLHSIGQELACETITPEQARQRIYELMNA